MQRFLSPTEPVPASARIGSPPFCSVPPSHARRVSRFASRRFAPPTRALPSPQHPLACAPRSARRATRRITSHPRCAALPSHFVLAPAPSHRACCPPRARFATHLCIVAAFCVTQCRVVSPSHPSLRLGLDRLHACHRTGLYGGAALVFTPDAAKLPGFPTRSQAQTCAEMTTKSRTIPAQIVPLTCRKECVAFCVAVDSTRKYLAESVA